MLMVSDGEKVCGMFSFHLCFQLEKHGTFYFCWSFHLRKTQQTSTNAILILLLLMVFSWPRSEHIYGKTWLKRHHMDKKLAFEVLETPTQSERGKFYTLNGWQLFLFYQHFAYFSILLKDKENTRNPIEDSKLATMDAWQFLPMLQVISMQPDWPWLAGERGTQSVYMLLVNINGLMTPFHLGI